MPPQPDDSQPKQSDVLVPNDVAADLPRFQASYQEKTGTRFEHYFCPFLHKDEPAEMCMGHVVPQSYANCCRTAIALRKDVDGFYGRVVEGHFGVLLVARQSEFVDLFRDKKLQREMRPQFLLGGQPVDYYPDRGDKNPNHTRVSLECQPGGGTVNVVFKKSPDEMMSSLGKDWGYAVVRDCRLSALVTLIRSAYLTLFHQHGYNWALSHAGIEVGYSMLGRFYRENHSKSTAEAREAMKDFFVPFKNMVRPIERFAGGFVPRGTLEDNFSGICYGSSGHPFAQVVYVRIGDQCHAVLMPGAENPESAVTYLDFLKNDNDKLKVCHTRFNHEKLQWEVEPEPVTAHWPKNHFTFEFD